MPCNGALSMTQVADDLPTPSREQLIGFMGLVFGMFMAVLDIQIVASSIAQIQAGISASTDEVTWVQTSYLIAEVIVIPLTGWLARVFSTRYVYFTAAFGFTVMSVAAACAWDIHSMIIFRALQGVFGGIMIPTTFSVVYTLFPKRMQPIMTIVIGSVVTMAPTIGPVLGGYLTEVFSWHVLFLINIIPGILVCMTTWMYVTVDRPQLGLLNNIDFLGIFYIAICLGCLQYVLEEGVRDQWFESAVIRNLSFLSLLCGILFVHRALRIESPAVDIRAFKNINFTLGCVFSFILGCGLYVMVYLLPLELSLIQRLSSYQIGIYVSVVGLFQFVSAPIAAQLSKHIDLRLMMVLGFGLFGLGCFLTVGQTADSGFWEFFLGQAIRGLSMMLCFMPINTLALGTLPVHEVPNASGLYNLMRNLGGAIGLAVFNTFLSNWQKEKYAVLRENIDPTKVQVTGFIDQMTDYLSSFSHLVDPNLGALKMLQDMAMREAIVMTFDDLYWLMGAIFFVSLCIIPFMKKVEFGGQTAGH